MASSSYQYAQIGIGEVKKDMVSDLSEVFNDWNVFVDVGNSLLGAPSSHHYINDWHTVIDFGKYKGYRLADVPDEYYQWLETHAKFGPVYDAITRIKSRQGVTTLIKSARISDQIPKLVIDTNSLIPIVERPEGISPSMYGYFVEFLIKHAMGIHHFTEVQKYLAIHGLEKLPEGLSMTGPKLTPKKRCLFINKSYLKTEHDPLDICNFSFCPKLLMNKHNESKASALYVYVKKNLEYYKLYYETIKNFKALPRLEKSNQDKCDKISVGCVIGVIDLIVDDTIIDIKCCAKENVNYYRKQLYTYACLYQLRYGASIKYCKIYNFYTGNVYSMDVGGISHQEAREHIKLLGCYCPAHVKLLS